MLSNQIRCFIQQLIDRRRGAGAGPGETGSDLGSCIVGAKQRANNAVDIFAITLDLTMKNPDEF